MSEDVKRYGFWDGDWVDDWESGEYVKYSDHQAKIEALEQEIDATKKELSDYMEWFRRDQKKITEQAERIKEVRYILKNGLYDEIAKRGVAKPESLKIEEALNLLDKE